METIEFEGKTLLINPGGDCPGCYFQSYHCAQQYPKLGGKYEEWYCITDKHDCNFILKEDGSNRESK
jgi:hypothetical protein